MRRLYGPHMRRLHDPHMRLHMYEVVNQLTFSPVRGREATLIFDLRKTTVGASC